MTSDEIRMLMVATQHAFNRIEAETHGRDEVYADLTTLFASHGLDANTAESAVDWLEAGPELLAESLGAALAEIRREHLHVWGSDGRCRVEDCGVINGLHDPDEWCHTCGAQFWINDAGVSFHLSDETPDQIDHDADADHVPYSLPEDEDE